MLSQLKFKWENMILVVVLTPVSSSVFLRTWCTTSMCISFIRSEKFWNWSKQRIYIYYTNLHPDICLKEGIRNMNKYIYKLNIYIYKIYLLPILITDHVLRKGLNNQKCKPHGKTNKTKRREKRWTFLKNSELMLSGRTGKRLPFADQCSV